LQFITANLIVFQGLKTPQLFDDNADKPKYYKNIIKVEDKELYLNRLLQYMKDETPYLNPQISLNDIASKLSITTNLLSQLLNTSLKMSFYDFINSFRIEEAKKLLLSYNPKQKTILEILYEVGFSSKSAFNIAFKKHTGVTPTVFRNQKG
jgi:AraC-like DNA-binding protein